MNLPNAIALTIKWFVKLSYFIMKFMSHHNLKSGRPVGPEGARGAKGQRTRGSDGRGPGG